MTFHDTFGRRLPKQRPWRDEPTWEDRFDACMKRLREIDAEEARLNREFFADMRGHLDTIEAEWNDYPKAIDAAREQRERG